MRYKYINSEQCLFAKVLTNHMKWYWNFVPYNIKIILQIVISVVWLTNFLSEIQNLINPWWWVEQLLLSVKRCENSCKDVLHIDVARYPLVGSEWRSCCLSGFQDILVIQPLSGAPSNRIIFCIESAKGACKYYISKFSRILDPPPP